MLRHFILLIFLSMPLRAQVDGWDLPPVNYSETAAEDRLARLAEKWSQNPGSVAGHTPLERVRGILAALQVPEASQVLVFSKTSKQNGLIRPDSPRALYFSRDVYCGYVPGGVMEVVIQDARLGPVFYHIDLGDATRPLRVERDTNDCLSCHASGRTEHVPGVLVRSVFPDANGQPILSMGTTLVTHQTPVDERWGGYYVTGSISLPHLGNQTYSDGSEAKPQIQTLNDLSGRFGTHKYPRSTSDIVALMVLEHQCQAHNLLTAASMNYRRAYYLGKAIHPNGDPDEGTAGRIADQAAQEIVSWFLYSGEAGQGPDGVEGNEEFQEQFEAGVPHTVAGDSLADFQLNGRLFKNRCSYMIYSDAFCQLPEAVKNRVIARLRNVLESPTTDDAYPHMKLPERRRIVEILDETGVW